MNTVNRKSSCFFCGDFVTSGSSCAGGSPTTNNVESHHHHINNWNKQCALSLCKVFRLPSSDPSSSILSELDYQNHVCSGCLQLIRDVDFSLRAILKIQSRIVNMRKKLHGKVSAKLQSIFGGDDGQTSEDDDKTFLVVTESNKIKSSIVFRLSNY